MKYICPECQKMHDYEDFYHQNGMCQSHEQPVKLSRYEDWLEAENRRLRNACEGLHSAVDAVIGGDWDLSDLEDYMEQTWQKHHLPIVTGRTQS